MAYEIVKYADLLPRMLRDLIGVKYTPFEANAALRDAGREFCNRSECWFEKLTAISVVADQQEYTLATDYPAHFKRVKSIRLLTSQEVTDGDEGSLVDPSYYRLNLPVTLKFGTGHIPATAVTDGMVVEVVFVPQMDADELPEWLFSRWGDAIIGKALYDLWRGTDLNKAAVFLNQYNAKLNEAMVESMDDIAPGLPGQVVVGLEIKESFTP